MQNIPVINNERQLHFELHTEMSDTLSGQGIASALALHAFEWAKEHNKKVIVYGPLQLHI